jgi:hypothetical protein
MQIESTAPKYYFEESIVTEISWGGLPFRNVNLDRDSN